MNKVYVNKFWKENKAEYWSDFIAGGVFDLTKKYLKGKHITILDAGAGNGSFVRYVKKQGFCNIFGVDIQPKGRGVIKGDITDLSMYYDNACRVSAIFCLGVVEHLTGEQLKKALEEFHKVLVPNGVLVVATLYKENLHNKNTKCPKCGERFHFFGHLHSFDKESLNKYFCKDFKLEKMWITKLGFRSLLGSFWSWIFYDVLHLDYFLGKKWGTNWFHTDVLMVLKK